MSDWEKEFEHWEKYNFGGGKVQRQLLKVGFEAAWDIQQAKLDEAIEVIRFYADHLSWEFSKDADSYCMRLTDTEVVRDSYITNKTCGGKKAREFLENQGVSE